MQALSGLRGTWGRMNLNAQSVMARGCYYPYKQQAHFWIAVDGSDTPTLKMVLQVSEVRSDGKGGVGRGWALANNTIAQAVAVGVLTETVSQSSVASISRRPYIGWSGVSFIAALWRCDDGGVDQHAISPYLAQIVTKPYIAAGLLNRWGVMTAALLASPSTSPFNVQLIRDFGVEVTAERDLTISAAGSEVFVITVIDDLRLSQARAIQVVFSDGGAHF